MRSEKISVRATLSNVRDGRANKVPDQRRLWEAQRIVAYWPWDILDYDHPDGAWSVLLEAATRPKYKEDPIVVHEWVRQWLQRYGKLPSVGELRQRFGYTRNHRLRGQVEGQLAMFGDER